MGKGILDRSVVEVLDQIKAAEIGRGDGGTGASDGKKVLR